MIFNFPRGWSRIYLFATWLLLSGVGRASPPPVSFDFSVPPNAVKPWSREIWGEVLLPSGKTLRVPAFYRGQGVFSVRVRADEKGSYRLNRATETIGDSTTDVALKEEAKRVGRVERTTTRAAVQISPRASDRFELANGAAYFPLGMNLAWSTELDRVGWYRRRFEEFSKAGLNWSRIWMAHWGGLNLDWPAGHDPKAENSGELDETVAERWDAILSAAEDNGVYVQMVLQHHGQVSSKVNPNWNENPWNAANPRGFLHSPAEFFTSAEALRLTRQKYRYVVARWGYSPAVLAWELFNEVHWVDAMRLDHNERAVAHWHDEMAAYLRSVDAYRHLVTTSTDDLKSPIYRSMDFLQPHLYATNMLAAVRRFDAGIDNDKRPVFYGEIGNDSMRLSAEQKLSGIDLAPLTWASLMGDSYFPAQIWEGAKVSTTERMNEVGAISRFIAATKLDQRDDLVPFSAAVVASEMRPLVIEPGDNWHRRPPMIFHVSAEGRQEMEYGIIPRHLVPPVQSRRDGYPSRVTFKVDFPKKVSASVSLVKASPAGARVRVSVDDLLAGEHEWVSVASGAVDPAPADPSRIALEMEAGPHNVVIENAGSGSQGWFEFGDFDTGFDTSVLATMGRRGAEFIMLWVYHRTGVFSLNELQPAAGTIEIEDVAAGSWEVVWWDTVSGKRGAATVIQHAGGALKLPSVPVGRHAGVVLTRI
jgi:hypothetical protein